MVVHGSTDNQNLKISWKVIMNYAEKGQYLISKINRRIYQ